MQSFTSIFLFLFPLLALSIPTTDYQIRHSRTFTLKSHVLAPANPSFENLYLEPYHIYPAFNYATLSPKTKKNPGIVGFLNGTEQELEYDQGNLLFSFRQARLYGFVIRGSFPFPPNIQGNCGFDGFENIGYGRMEQALVNVETTDSVNSTYNPIEINAGSGTKGIYINQGVIKYNNPISGGFYGRCHPLPCFISRLFASIFPSSILLARPVNALTTYQGPNSSYEESC